MKESAFALHQRDCRQTDQQCKEDVLVLPVKRLTPESKVKRDFGDDAEKGKAHQIFPYVFGMEQPFHQQENKNGKADPADTAGNVIKFMVFQAVIADIHKIKKKSGSEMIDQHRYHGDQFQVSAVDFPRFTVLLLLAGNFVIHINNHAFSLSANYNAL